MRIAAGAVGLFIAVFSVIYAQTASTAKVTSSQNRVAAASSSATGTSSSSGTSATPMTTSQS